MLIDHVQEFESVAVGRPCPLALPGDGTLQALLPPEPLHPFVVHAPALSSEEAVGHPPAPANVLSCNLAETMTQLSLLDRDDLGRMTLGAAMLTHHTAGQPLKCPATLLQERYGSAPASGLRSFPSHCKVRFIAQQGL